MTSGDVLSDMVVFSLSSSARSRGSETETTAGEDAGGVDHAIRHDDQKGDPQTRDDALTRIDLGERCEGLLLKTSGAHQRGNHQHTKRHHQHLVHSEQIIWQRQWDLH